MKKIIFLLLFPVLVLAQDYKLGNVTLQELKQKQHPTDTSAVAAILFNKGKTYFDFINNSHFVLTTEIEVKIKIYKKEGLDWANKEIAYYVGGQVNESVLINKAITYNLINGKIEKTKLNGDGEFKENVNKFWATKKITMPNVKEGSIIEYKYTIISPYFSNLQDWKFQETIPVDYSEYTTIVPEYYDYNFYTRGSLFLNIKKETKNKNIEIIKKELQGVSTSNASYVSNNTLLSFVDNVTTIIAEKSPAFVEEPYSNSIENYISSISYQLISTKYPNELLKVYSETWENVAKTIYESSEFGIQLNKDNYYEYDYIKLISGKELDINEKINTIYNHVRYHYKWNEMNGVYTDVGVSKAYKDKVGNVAEINFTLISMLRKAGLKANPILLTTRSKPINLYPTTTAFNYVICGVEIGDKIIFLDATDKNLKRDVLPDRALNYIGRLISENTKSKEIDLSPNMHSKSSVMILANIDDQVVKGSFKKKLTENRAYNFRNKNSLVSEESYIENIEKSIPGFEISDYTIENKTNSDEPIKEDYNFSSTNEIEVINDKIFFKPLLFFALDENPFKQEKRDYPIDFIYPSADSYIFTFIIPSGYIVESMPSNINIEMVDKIMSFKFLTGITGNKIQLVCDFNKNMSFLPAEYYQDLKAFYNQVFLKMNEKIVLKKQ